jgi:hypothetical protein
MPGPPRRRLQLGLFEAAALDAGSCRQGQERGQVKGQAAVDLGLTATAHPAKGQARVRHPAGLDEVGFSDRQFGQRRLQALVVEERYTHRVVSAQGLGQQFRKLVADVLVTLQGRWLGDAFLRHPRDFADTAVRGKTRTAHKQGGARRNCQVAQDGACRRGHCFSASCSCLQ